ncbi:hypothetical protein BKA70DRAFT_1402002 [Coprinopsis sp. MPI-PUGE-AT-0042]|nr:hypothetical protein BKA70DRAFT_1402002 [Coprinopsis sp. MPI-PUGE-AT-0042]
MSTSTPIQNTFPPKGTHSKGQENSDESDLDDFNLGSGNESEEAEKTTRKPNEMSSKTKSSSNGEEDMDVVTEELQLTDTDALDSQIQNQQKGCNAREQQQMHSAETRSPVVTKALIEVRQARDQGIARYTAAVEQKIRLQRIIAAIENILWVKDQEDSWKIGEVGLWHN